ncbi:MAG: di-trans,poly-cis-decaprenylcistransferase [Clostridiales bacterium]|nr:di-trans,poly-cis-decaprenylcistransferase [Clostridiales bacterium]MCF8021390.1 di-trans,poly-cis-decaprenylcistransferase [Clostridiales bacterium]
MRWHELHRIPTHIGIIPDGNRRWAVNKGLSKEKGYIYGLKPGIKLYELCREMGVKELTFYGFTQDNTKRPSVQTNAFRKACVDAVRMLSQRDASLLVIGDVNSPLFPRELKPYTEKRKIFGKGLFKINFLVNYGWKWDINKIIKSGNINQLSQKGLFDSIASSQLSRIDLIIRWGGRRRLSGFLPIQTVYSDIYVIDDLWPDFKKEHFYKALKWYQDQDVTLGG